MRGVVLAAALFAVLSAGPAKAGNAPDGQAAIRGCITAAAKVYRLPPAVLVILLNVEGGSLGRVSPNTNGTVDIGPIQVNQIWLPEVAAHWHATIADAYKALRDNFCANVEAGAWILRRGLDEARGDFWEGVGYYHSHGPEHKTRYLQEVLRQVLRLRALVEHADTSARPNVAQATAPPLAPWR
jgi:hypothetical protein